MGVRHSGQNSLSVFPISNLILPTFVLLIVERFITLFERPASLSTLDRLIILDETSEEGELSEEDCCVKLLPQFAQYSALSDTFFPQD